MNITSPIYGVSVSAELGAEIEATLEATTVTMKIVSETFITLAPSMNVLADTPMGDPTQTIVVILFFGDL
jgi:hypothetical protein